MRALIVSLLILTGLPPAAAGEDRPAEPPGLAELAAAADLIALAQVRDTDYLRRREIPVSGSAYLKVLIPYKLDAPVDILEVYEKGLRDNECYFPNPTVFEEGRRYLLFLRRDPEDGSRYRGMPQGCALEVLVARDNRYALRYPLSGIQISDPPGGLARALEFRDPYAVVADEMLPPALREQMLQAGQIVPYSASDAAGSDPSLPPSGDRPERRWLYTQGIPFSELREILNLDQVTDGRPQRETAER
jgi:hypothetical protein